MKQVIVLAVLVVLIPRICISLLETADVKFARQRATGSVEQIIGGSEGMGISDQNQEEDSGKIDNFKQRKLNGNSISDTQEQRGTRIITPATGTTYHPHAQICLKRAMDNDRDRLREVE